jgi:hypothetical protein
MRRRLELIQKDPDLRLLEVPEYKRKWEPLGFAAECQRAAKEWSCSHIEETVRSRGRPVTAQQVAAAVQDDARLLAVASLLQRRRDVDIARLVSSILEEQAVPNHPFHIYTTSGLTKRAAWENIWSLQRRQDAGEKIDRIPEPPEYSQGSRGKPTDFLRDEYWRLRGRLDVSQERFIAFTEVPGRSNGELLYGWAGCTPLERLRMLLGIDETLEDAGLSLADRAALLDSAWRLLPDAAREDAAVAKRLKAEVQALVGIDGPSRETLDDWRRRFPPPSARGGRRPQADSQEVAAR